MSNVINVIKGHWGTHPRSDRPEMEVRLTEQGVDAIQSRVVEHIVGGPERERLALQRWRIMSDADLHPLAYGYEQPPY